MNLLTALARFLVFPGLLFAVPAAWFMGLAAGLSAMPTRTFAAVTALGMLPLLSISVCAGAELGTISSPADVLSPRCVAALAILGAAPLAARGLARRGRSLRAALLKPH